MPIAVSVYHVILILNFLHGILRELEETAFIDGNGHWRTCFSIFIPLMLPERAAKHAFTGKPGCKANRRLLYDKMREEAARFIRENLLDSNAGKKLTARKMA